MLRISESESVAAAKKYFGDSLRRGDYYLEGQEIAGQWGGKGARMLGLSGLVDRDLFCGLLENQHPDGGRLTPRMVKNRRPGYDFTFDVPKSVSLMHAIGGDERIVGAMQKALNETMTEIEKEMHTRVRKGGADEDRRTGNMLWADFTHFTSRPAPLGEELEARLRESRVSTKGLLDEKGKILLPDPHLHVHVYAVNATFDPVEGQWKAGVFMQAKRDATYYQAAYHTRLAGELQKLGYEIEPTANAFELAGIGRTIIEKFSRRTKEVDEAAEALGIVDDKTKSELGAKTRHAKQHDLTLPELKNLWKAVAGSESAEQLAGMVKASMSSARGLVNDNHHKAIRSIDFAFMKELERVSETSEKRLLASALAQSIGSASVESVEKAYHAKPDVLCATINGEKRVSTVGILKEETILLEKIRETKGTVPPLVEGTYQFSNPLFAEESAKEQRQAVEKIMSTQDWVCGLVGRAGTGKTTLLKEIEAGLKSVGSRIVAVAPTAEASRGVLRGEGFPSADTVKRLLVDQEFQKKLTGSVLWIDEAGMLGNRDMIALLELAKLKGARKVVLSGDPTQIRSVPRGDALRFLEENSGLVVARLKTIQRQKDEKLLEAVDAISRSEASRGLQILEKNGHVIEGTTKQMHQRLATAYVKRVGAGKRSVLAICPTHKEGELITAQIREKLKVKGVIGKDDKSISRTVNLGWTESEKTNAASYDIGMVVQFRSNAEGFVKSERARVTCVDGRSGSVTVLKNSGDEVLLPMDQANRFDVYRLTEMPVALGDRLRITQNTYVGSHRFNNGDVVRVVGFTADGGIDVGNGKTLPPHFGHLAHGYVHTADASQAKTVDSVLIGIGRDSMGATDMRRFYVGVSRARYEAKIFTDDYEGLQIAAQRDSVRLTATELVGKDRARQIIDQIHRHERMKREKAVQNSTKPALAQPFPNYPKQPRQPIIEMEI